MLFLKDQAIDTDINVFHRKTINKDEAVGIAGSPFIFKATVLAKTKTQFISGYLTTYPILIGFLAADAPQNNVFETDRGFFKAAHTDYSSNLLNYKFACWANSSWLIDSVYVPSIKSTSNNVKLIVETSYGHSCSQCPNYYPDAEHNTANGKFVCTACKLWNRLC